ncbi:MAG: glycosyltransferase family 39 protein, partial [Patescibacteria group bacterium]
LAYCFLNFSTTYHFNSPDEVQYFNFAKNYSQTWQMNYTEPLNEIANGTIKPRWMESKGDQVFPGIVVGFPMIYGLLAKLFSWQAIIYLTPILAIIGVWFFYLLIEYIFDDKRLALLSSFLLFIQPAWWYYASRTMFNNIAFLTFLLAGIYLLLKALDNKKACLYCVSGIMIGLALITRLSEIIWVGMAFILILVLKRNKINWLGLGLGFLSLILVFWPVLNLNQHIYGSYFNFGYNPASVSSGAQLEQSQTIVNQAYHLIKLVLVPFGFSLHNIWQNFKDFILQFFWITNLFFLLGIFFVIKNWRQTENKPKGFLLILAGVVGLILLSYGSWYFADVVSGSRVTIGSSYLRYFLPIYLLMIPWIALGLLKIKAIPQYKWVYKIAIFICFIFCFKLVYLDLNSGLIKIQQDLTKNQIILEKIDQLAEKNSIFITGSLDKALYPEKKVIYALQKDADFEAVKNLIQAEENVYQLVFTDDLQKWLNENQIKFESFEMSFDKTQKVRSNLYLVKIVQK